MKKASLISFALLFLMVGLAAADYPWWLDNVEIVPPNPTSSDIISVTLSGQWGDTCVPNDSGISVTANNIHFDVISDYPPDLMCLPICCFEWQRTESVGPLPAGIYTVYTGRVWPPSPPEPYQPVAELAVTGLYYYVAVDGNDSNNGLTPETAFATIQKGIDTAQNGDTVIVLPGLYVENINFLGKDITLTSMDPNDEAVVDSTIIDGNDVNSVVTFSGTESSDCVITGFTITNGYATEGGGIRGNGTMATITKNIISNNVVQRIGPLEPQSYGGGLYDCDGLIQDNIITGNIAEYMGHGGAMYDCDGTIRNNVISENSAIIGGGLRLCDGTISNNLVVGNIGLEGGGFLECSGSINHCTVVGNKWNGLRNCTGSIKNCLIWHNGNGPEGNQLVDCNMPSYSCIQSWDGGGIGNMNTDPCFARAGYWQWQEDTWVWVDNDGDYHLQSAAGRWDPNSETWITDANTSRCIDAGNPGSPPADEPAPNGNRINVGAYGGTAQASKSPANWALLSDMTNDGKMNHDDLGVFVGYWLEGGQNIPSDLDRNQSVDSADYAIFAGQWSDAYVAEPTIVYEVYPCDPNQVPDSNEPRFRLWAEGSYIYFEDMINANCCADEIELQMTVEGNQITIREIEHLTMPCDCMCDFPTTATLGPFEDGAYLVAVIDIYGNTLGVVLLTIGELAQPGITYQVGDCYEGASASLSLTQQSDETRFTATVDGQYIHFEDMMVANCCPDELELQMTIEGDLITIYEIEHTTMPCHCVCEYPVTATLGPFEPGTYTLEVYQHNYSADPILIGSTTVVID